MKKILFFAIALIFVFGIVNINLVSACNGDTNHTSEDSEEHNKMHSITGNAISTDLSYGNYNIFLLIKDILIIFVLILLSIYLIKLITKK